MGDLDPRRVSGSAAVAARVPRPSACLPTYPGRRHAIGVRSPLGADRRERRPCYVAVSQASRLCRITRGFARSARPADVLFECTVRGHNGGAMRNRMRRLSSQIFVAQLVILTTTVLVGFGLFVRQERAHLDNQYEARAASIAETTAGVPDDPQLHAARGSGLRRGHPAHRDDHREGDRRLLRRRHRHEPGAALAPQPGPDRTTGRRADRGGRRPGPRRASTTAAPAAPPTARRRCSGSTAPSSARSRWGSRESSVSSALRHELPSYAAWFGIALGLGAVASWALARRLKRRTFGLELDEIALLLQEREATLHGIREGVIAFDIAGRVSMVNDQAQHLLGLDATRGRAHRWTSCSRPDGCATCWAASARHRTTSSSPTTTPWSSTGCRSSLAGRPHGAVVTLRDRTELAALLRELDGERGLTESLRAQQHEFANRMHAVAGLLGAGPNRRRRCTTSPRSEAPQPSSTTRCAPTSPPRRSSGCCWARRPRPANAGSVWRSPRETWLSESPGKVQVLTTVVGNLVDNAMDAVAGCEPPRRVVVEIVEDDGPDHRRRDRQRPGRPSRAGAAHLPRRIHHQGPPRRPAARPRAGARAPAGDPTGRLGRGHAGPDGTGARFTVTIPKGQPDRPSLPSRRPRPAMTAAADPGADRRRRLPRRRHPRRLRRADCRGSTSSGRRTPRPRRASWPLGCSRTWC